MLVKVIDENSNDYNKEFKVRRMNYDQVVVNYPNDKGINVFLNDNLEFIAENSVDEFLMQYKDFLKIKLNRGISVSLYKVLLKAIEEQFKIEFESLNLLKDKYQVNKRGIWEKEIFCVINNLIPIKIYVSGENFKKNNFNLNISKVSDEEFFEICTLEINKIRHEIEEKNKILSRYGLAIESVKGNLHNIKMLM